MIIKNFKPKIHKHKLFINIYFHSYTKMSWLYVYYLNSYISAPTIFRPCYVKIVFANWRLYNRDLPVLRLTEDILPVRRYSKTDSQYGLDRAQTCRKYFCYKVETVILVVNIFFISNGYSFFSSMRYHDVGSLAIYLYT